MKIALLISTLIFNAQICLGSQAMNDSSPSPGKSHSWRASWITSPDAPAKGECVLRFRKTISVQSVPQHYNVFVSADNQFLLSVNGRLIAAGPSHSDIQHWKYETLDIAPQLKPGANQIAATVWNFADHAAVRQISNRIGFVIESSSDASVDLRSDDTWDVAVDRGISTLATPLALQHSPYFASPAELIDGHSMLWNLGLVDEPHTHRATIWKKASLIGRASEKGSTFAATNWQLVPDDLPQMERVEQDAGSVVNVIGIAKQIGNFPRGPAEIPAHGQVSILIDNGHLTTAYPELAVGRGEGATVSVTYAEALYDEKGEKGNRNSIKAKHIFGIFDEIHPNGDPAQVYSPLEWRTWRYLQIDINAGSQPLDLLGLRTFFTAYPFHQRATFSSNDPTLTRIWDIGWLTARLCAHDTYMDTPYWEQLQYVGDTRIEALISYTVAGDDRLARQAISAFRNSILPEGITQSRYPSSRFQSIPGFSLQWIGMVHDFWMYRNHPEFVRQQLPVVRTVLDWYRKNQNKNGLMGKLPWWPFVDWANEFETGVPPQTQSGDSAVLSLEFIEALRYAADLEENLGNRALAEEDKTTAARISAAVLNQCWDEREKLIADTPEKKHFSQHANALAVWLGVIPAADQQPVMLKILSASEATFGPNTAPANTSLASYYYRFYIARAMNSAGLGDRYLELLAPWRAMVANGLTTWAETPEPTRSDSHAWSAHPNYDLLSTVAGITPATPGFRTVRIEPHLGKLHHAAATLPSPSGLIKVVINIETSKKSAEISLPAGTSGEFIWNGRSYQIGGGPAVSIALGN